MGREIKFRGKSIDEDKWLYGSYAHVHDVNGYKSIIPEGDNRFLSVYNPTIGQFTGRKDRKGEEVYEGDIISDWSGGEEEMIFPVVWNDVEGQWYFGKELPLYELDEECFEVIGNISESPDLLTTSDRQQ